MPNGRLILGAGQISINGVSGWAQDLTYTWNLDLTDYEVGQPFVTQTKVVVRAKASIRASSVQIDSVVGLFPSATPSQAAPTVNFSYSAEGVNGTGSGITLTMTGVVASGSVRASEGGWTVGDLEIVSVSSLGTVGAL